ncbi:hypothetical protein AUJ68_04755 [Candidatus Woesearchaeota archaeon CG1_02_57_44]|nr:MAG: hypothetical protein AUJ68_04755 [Candidatus Woesearchaeota archaeon CG1_02_57_44]
MPGTNEQKPSSATQDIMSMEDEHQLYTYSKYPIAIEKGEGAFVYDIDSNRYLDFYGGHAVALTGHCHPKVVHAIQNQAATLIFYSNAVYNSTRAKAAEALVKLTPEGITKVFFCNSGAEANETAIKAARLHTGRTQIIAMKEGFHGRTYGSMSATGIDKYRIFPPLVPGIDFAEFGSLESIKALASQETAAIILEPIQSMAGVRVAAKEYFIALRNLCDELGILLIFDEVQTGMGRTGAPFYSTLIGVTPDIITSAKGIASGVPMGACFLQEKIAAGIKPGQQGSTFGGGPLACAAALATAELLQEQRLPENAAAMGDYLMRKLVSMPHVKDVRGQGLLIGIEFGQDAKPLVKQLLKHQVLVSGSEDPKTIRLLPPLVISQEHADIFLAALKSATDEVFGAKDTVKQSTAGDAQ